MKLKKLEISGFKSFFEKESIEFPVGISAIVGPNGCGKSNVVDALRWVMGEQSVKTLRGKSMEDVIFAGTKGKMPLNMAEVSLVLRNDNGSAPEELKDFTEIMLTRRLYRSGESAYLINKQPCRLKDVQRVFLGSGLGAKSYAVIQQGNIGAITDAGPDERRFFIEEAAGTTIFKSKKMEALRKVKTTNANLLRINDIIYEIKRQMASLKRQARKAELFKTHQERIKQLDIGLALFHYDNFTQDIDKADSLLKELKDADIGHSTQLEKLDLAIEEIKLQRWEKNQEISTQKTNKYEMQRDIDRTENDLAHFKKDVERLAMEAAELESAREELKEKRSKMESEVARCENQSGIIQKDIDETRIVLEKLQSDSAGIKEKLSVLNGELESCNTELVDKVAQEARYKNIYQNASSNKANLKRRLKRAKEEEAIAKKEAADALKRETGAKQKLASLKQKISDLSNRIEITGRQLDDKSKTLAGQVKHVQTLEFEKNNIKSNHAALKKMEDGFEWYKDGVQAIMKAHGTKPEGQNSDTNNKGVNLQNGVICLMADIIDPKPGFATAVEAALGESLQYILVKDQQAGLDAVDYLQSNSAGRSGFIPISTIRQIEYGQQKKPAPAKLLLNHVAVKEGFEKITRALLGHIIVADNMEEARTIFNRNGALQTVVTKDGDVLSHQGLIIGGSKDKFTGIFTKKQEIRDLKRSIDDLDRKLESARQDQTEMESELRILESDLQELIEQKNKVSQQEVESEKDFYKASEDLKHCRHHLEIVGLEQQQLMGEESDADEEMAEYNNALADISHQIENLQNTVAEKSAQADSISAQVNAFDQETVELKLKLTSLNARLENNRNTADRLKEFLDDNVEQLKQLIAEISRKNQKENYLKQKIKESEQKLYANYEDIKILQLDIDNNEKDYQKIDSTLKDSDDNISGIRKKREKVLEKFRMLELEQSQRHLKRENIENRLIERYHMTISQIKAENEKISKELKQTVKMSPDEMEEELSRLQKKVDNFSDVNLSAIKEYEQHKIRFDFLSKQHDDLVKAVEDLQKVIKKIDRITQERFMNTLSLVNEKLCEVFPRLFEGGTAKLVLSQPDNPLETGVEFMIHPPGKKLTRMSLLSGGEKALSAIAFIFSLFLIKPTSFCLLDEIDAPLDDVNVYRFNDLLQLIGQKSQIVMVTHNKSSMEFADTLFGITMEQKGISKVVSVNFEQQEEMPN
ncbi:MAG: chromosome segregation protein SMC [Thermodesulfobacteriota bacterium]|nr:chromosome segregation protein SMC [Thermodesulfobacteriota bacterium]